MEFSEQFREKFDLPLEILDQQADAIAAEAWWHIFDVFGYETGVLSKDDLRLLYARFVHEGAHADHGLRRLSACNAFVWFVSQNRDQFCFTDAQLAEWAPSSEPFCYFEFEVDENDSQ